MFSQIDRLKRKARSAYLRRAAIFDEMDCGHELAMFISSRYRDAHNTFEQAMAELRKLDPTCPPAA